MAATTIITKNMTTNITKNMTINVNENMTTTMTTTITKDMAIDMAINMATFVIACSEWKKKQQKFNLNKIDVFFITETTRPAYSLIQLALPHKNPY